MKKIIATLLLALPFSLSALAADPPAKKEMTPQQQKMVDCNAKAKGLKGDEFKNKRDACLSGKEEAAPAAPAKKMTLGECSTKNKGLKGDEFKKAQSECMSGGDAKPAEAAPAKAAAPAAPAAPAKK